MQVYLRQLTDARSAFDRAHEAVSAATLWDFSQFSTAEDIEKCRAALETLETTLKPLEELLDAEGAALARELARHRVSESASRDMVRGFRGPDGSRTRLLHRITTLQHDLVGLMKSHVELAGENFGRWRRREDGTLVFQDTAAMRRFNDLVAQGQAIEEEQIALRQQALNLGR